MEVTKRVSDIMEDLELQKKLAYIKVDEEYNNCVSKVAMKWFKDMEECIILSGDPNLEITPSWLNWAFNSMSREKCLREVRKAMAIYMALSFEGSKNIRCSLAFFDKVFLQRQSHAGVMEVQCLSGEKLVRERGARSGERGVGISYPNFLKFWRPWKGRPMTVDNESVDFEKLLELAPIAVIEKMSTKER
jgi:hypothetical protein